MLNFSIDFSFVDSFLIDLGLRRVVAKCADSKGRAVEGRLCAGIARPENRTVACNVEPCPAR